MTTMIRPSYRVTNRTTASRYMHMRVAFFCCMRSWPARDRGAFVRSALTHTRSALRARLSAIPPSQLMRYSITRCFYFLLLPSLLFSLGVCVSCVTPGLSCTINRCGGGQRVRRPPPLCASLCTGEHYLLAVLKPSSGDGDFYTREDYWAEDVVS